jgi:hypothetical protein
MNTLPDCWRSEAFPEDLPDTPAPVVVEAARRRVAGWMFAAPAVLALAGLVAALVLGH